jgi:hypothetical protein
LPVVFVCWSDRDLAVAEMNKANTEPPALAGVKQQLERCVISN